MGRPRVGISRPWFAAKVIGLAGVLIVFNFFPQSPALLAFGPIGVWVMEDLGVELRASLLNLWLVLNLVVASVVLARGGWTRGLRWLELGEGVLAASILITVLIETTTAFAAEMPLPELWDPFDRQMVAWIIQGALAIGFVLTLVVIVRRSSRLLQATTARARPATGENRV